MKKKAIIAIVAIVAMVIVLFLIVRLVIGVTGGLNQSQTAVVETHELSPLGTPEADIYSDDYYDEPDELPIGTPAPTGAPEEMVAVPVIETPEELAGDEG